MSFKDNNGTPEITQENHTGAWGEALQSLNYLNSTKTNNFTYSTYEQENDFGIGVFDAHARVFDPIIGRTWQFDPLNETTPSVSPASFLMNSPVLFTDPDGQQVVYNWFSQQYEENGNAVDNQMAMAEISNSGMTAGSLNFGNGKGNLILMNRQPWETVNYKGMNENNKNWDILDVESGNISAQNELLSAYYSLYGSIKNTLFFSHGIEGVGLALIQDEKYKLTDKYSGYLDKEAFEGLKISNSWHSKNLMGFVNGLRNIAEKMGVDGNFIFSACNQSNTNSTKLLVSLISDANPNINAIFQNGYGLFTSSGTKPRQNISLIFGQNIATDGATMFNSNGKTVFNEMIINKTGKPIILR